MGKTPFLLILALVLCFAGQLSAQTGAELQCGDEGIRVLPQSKPGSGRSSNNDGKVAAYSICTLHYVQVGIGCDNEPLYPVWLTGVWTVYDERVRCTDGTLGAYYGVKPFATEEEARNWATTHWSEDFKCWYNPQLAGRKFTIVGVIP